MNFDLIRRTKVIVEHTKPNARRECTCDKEGEERDKAKALRYKIATLVSILVASAFGVCIPLLGKVIPTLSPEKDIFFIIKAFAAGVILATGFTHILPDGFENLTSPCINEHPCGDFSFTGFVAMCTAMGILMVDSYATAYFKRHHSKGAQVEAMNYVEKESGHVHLHTHATHAHAHGHVPSDESPELLRHLVISQVSEQGITVHSVVIGISLGASESPKIIRRLVAALTFHQFFEGMGLGRKFQEYVCYNNGVVLHVNHTPVEIGIGIRIASIYDENSPTELIAERIFDNTASAGILIYMALVDLLAADFRNPRMQKSGRHGLGFNLSPAWSWLRVCFG
ncbi:Zinc transporter 1 [Spatholobus suberectus]|nr:Zinc transporter 1 [Spatholobus suberectus]